MVLQIENGLVLGLFWSETDLRIFWIFFFPSSLRLGKVVLFKNMYSVTEGLMAFFNDNIVIDS